MIRIVIDSSECTGCGDCIKVCKSRCLEIVDGLCVAARPSDCKLCMLCRAMCPQNAIAIEV